MRLRRRRKHPRDRGMSRFAAGLIAITLIAVGTYFGFTKTNPFASPYRLSAVFDNVNNLKPNSPVRIAGVDIGKVKSVEALTGGRGAARVEMEILDKGLPIHTDAQIKVRPRIFLEGNFFVDIKPGSPSAPVLEDGGDPIPVTQTAAPVQFGDLLAALESDTRADLQTFLKEYSAGLAGKGARGFNQSFRNGEEAFKNTAIVNDASLGLEPTRDVQRLLRGQAKTFAALVKDESALKSLVTDFNTTAGAFASEDAALEATLPALRDVLRVGSPALASLNSSLPSLRAFAVDALPGVRSSAPTLEASLPFIRQVRALVSPEELQSVARQLRRHLPALTRLNRRMIPFLNQARLLSSCTNEVLVPFSNTPIPNPDEAENSGQTFVDQANRGLVGLSGESRLSDGNNTFFHTSLVPAPRKVRPAPPPDGGDQPPPRRPDVACETQESPNLEAPGGDAMDFPSSSAAAKRGPDIPLVEFDAEKIQQAGRLLQEWEATEGAERKQRTLQAIKRLAEEEGAR